ncbi:sulfurtransferase TusA family protein [Tissierella praeacuta]|uniref:sulfurtransferase TusA family protein n=1 Tax=Tissierella praeacuta TaxID=43131 RepID=UPI0014051EA6|nr:sulfurtransferase TusA family protein [Tissierella praeacuta]MBU5255884.1 sulfurtransferase TusA family protein [Tissierella praeacuta]
MIKKIDCLGDFCPIPSIKAKLAYERMNRGEKIIILSDHSCAPINIINMMKQYNCILDINEPIAGIYEITIKKLD